jgi:hypothetical protein
MFFVIAKPLIRLESEYSCRRTRMTSALAIMLKPILGGWAVCLTDGRVLARFRGPGARWRALRFLSQRGVGRG